MAQIQATTLSAQPADPLRYHPNAGRRDFGFDLLRVVGLFSIVLAHVDPPVALWAIRSFDVPLMVLVSGAVFQIGYAGRSIELGLYFRQRAFRLLAPVYAFLILYFAVSELLVPGRFQARMIWRTFLLLDGAGYVWIIRVFLFVAIAAPFLFAWRRRLTATGFLLLLSGVYLTHELLFAWFAAQRPFQGDELLEFTVFYFLPYSVVFGLGLLWPGMSRLSAVTMAVICLGICGALFVVHSGVPLQTLVHDHKYPPHLLYFWYGLGASHLLYAAVLSLPALPARITAAIQWLSASSLWIYLWHIAGLTLAAKILQRFDPGAARFAAAWGLTVGFAITATLIQKSAVRGLITRMALRNRMADTLSVVFLK